jgi:CBS domain-containing protein
MTTTFTSEEVATVAGADHGQLRVRDLMTLEPVTVRGGAPLVVADLLMRDLGVSGLPVIDGKGALIGVLSRTDLMALAGDPRVDAWQGRSVAATMTAPGLTIEADAPLIEAAARIEEHHVHRLVVVEPEGGHPIGILSTTDIVRAVAAGATAPSVSRRVVPAHGSPGQAFGPFPSGISRSDRQGVLEEA